MVLLFIGGLLLGIILGRCFKVLVLVPICGVAIVLVLAAPPVAAQSAAQLILEVVLLLFGIQFGYAAGMISTNLSTVLQASRRAFASSAHSAGSRSLHVR